MTKDQLEAKLIADLRKYIAQTAHSIRELVDLRQGMMGAGGPRSPTGPHYEVMNLADDLSADASYIDRLTRAIWGG